MTDRRSISAIAWKHEQQGDPDPPPPIFGDLLRRFRLAADLTQDALAERANISARAISDRERRVKKRPQKETVRLLADALALPADERILFERAVRGRAVAHPPLRAIGVPTHNLPAPTTFGRSLISTLVGPSLHGIMWIRAAASVSFLREGSPTARSRWHDAAR